MRNFEQVPVTAAVFTAVTIFLSGCIAYDAARSSGEAGTVVAGTGISLASTGGSLVISALRHKGEDASN
jgi:hypothetical protein